MVLLARAAQTMRRHMFEEGEPFNGFPEGCQEDYVPSLLLALVSMVLEGPRIKDQMADTTPAALAIAQMLTFNCIKHNREHPNTGLVTARHSAAQETPVPTYVGIERVLPWYSYLPPPAPLFHWRRSGPKHCNRWWI